MDATTAAEQELNLMLDEGVRAEVTQAQAGAFVLRITLEDAACAECLVPDDTLAAITRDALERGGATVGSLEIEHAG